MGHVICRNFRGSSLLGTVEFGTDAAYSHDITYLQTKRCKTLVISVCLLRRGQAVDSNASSVVLDGKVTIFGIINLGTGLSQGMLKRQKH